MHPQVYAWHLYHPEYLLYFFKSSHRVPFKSFFYLPLSQNYILSLLISVSLSLNIFTIWKWSNTIFEADIFLITEFNICRRHIYWNSFYLCMGTLQSFQNGNKQFASFPSPTNIIAPLSKSITTVKYLWPFCMAISSIAKSLTSFKFAFHSAFADVPLLYLSPYPSQPRLFQRHPESSSSLDKSKTYREILWYNFFCNLRT